MDFSLVLFLASAVLYFFFALKKKEEAVFALPLFFPLYLWKGSVGGVPLTMSEMLVYVTFLAYAGRGLFGIFTSGRKAVLEEFSSVFKRRFWLPILLILIGAVIGVAVTKQSVLLADGETMFLGRKVALGILKAWIFCPILMFGLFCFAVKKTGDVLKMLNYYTVSAIILSVWGLGQVATQSFLTSDARASGPFESANYLALYMAPAVLYLAIRIRELVIPVVHLEKYSFWKIPFKRGKAPLETPEIFFFILGFLLLFLAIIFTKSYAAITALLLAAFFYFGLEYFEYRKNKEHARCPWKMLLAAFAFIAVILAVIFVIDPSKLAAVFQFGARNSSSVRVEVYTIALNLLKENWLTGIGPGQFPAYYQIEAVRILGHVPYEWNMLHPHNLYVAFWLNLGITGFAGFVGTVYVMLAACWRDFQGFAFRAINEPSKLRVMGVALLLVVLLHGLLDTPFFKNDLAMLFWLVAAVILLPGRSEAKAKK
jgi:O-antigen ligase